MKDLYSFHKDTKDLDIYYEKVIKAYFQILKRCGLDKETFLTFASGGAFSKYSHEFQTIAPNGEDEIYLCKKCKLAVNKEIISEENNQCPKCKSKDLEVKKAIEVGNIFKLGERFSKSFDFHFKDKDDKEKLVQMGCYGIGPSRIMGTIAEVYYDDRGIIWPEEIAPFRVHLIQIENSQKVVKEAEKLYKDLEKKGVEVLYDDRAGKTAGEKFADADLIGIPLRLVVSERTLAKKSVEVKKRGEKEARLIKISSLMKEVC
jgi:prolyl-tRNA synthetase